MVINIDINAVLLFFGLVAGFQILVALLKHWYINHG
jgi:hypothetical protein